MNLGCLFQYCSNTATGPFSGAFRKDLTQADLSCLIRYEDQTDMLHSVTCLTFPSLLCDFCLNFQLTDCNKQISVSFLLILYSCLEHKCQRNLFSGQ